MNSTVLYWLAGVLVFAGIMLWLLFRLHQHASELNVEKYRRKWLEIERQLSRNDHRSCQFAIVEADKLLDIAMKEKGIRGETMGERLKSAKSSWSNENAVWSAHKLRNQIVHEADVKISYDNSRRALAGFKKALKDMGAI